MATVKEIDRIAFELWCNVGVSKDLEDWAENQLRQKEPHPDACVLLNLSDEDAKKESLRLAKEIKGFQPISEKGEEWAKEILKQQCALLLSEKITPFKFCRIVNIFDSSFSDMRMLDDKTFEYPEWLGDLRNQCDWCDESWILENSPDLKEEVKKISNKLK